MSLFQIFQHLFRCKWFHTLCDHHHCFCLKACGFLADKSSAIAVMQSIDWKWWLWIVVWKANIVSCATDCLFHELCYLQISVGGVWCPSFTVVCFVFMWFTICDHRPCAVLNVALQSVHSTFSPCVWLTVIYFEFCC